MAVVIDGSGRGRSAAPYPFVLHRALFWGAAILGMSIFWLAEHPPMVDLPAHGGQVALMRDLLLGEGRWAQIMRINWFTPYLLGYGLALPLSLVMPVSAALKLLLSFAYIAFVVMCLKLADHFDSDPRLHPLFLVSFFGVSYHWGFLTFLMAAPVALAFILLAARYARNPRPGAGLAVLAVGLALLASHGLAFMLGWAIGAALLAAELRRAGVKRLAGASLPFAGLALAFVAYYLVSRVTEAQIAWESWFRMDLTPIRLAKIVLFTIGHGASEDRLLLLGVAAVLMASPFLLGLRFRGHHWRGAMPLLITGAVLLTLPSFMLSTSFIYERFALYLLPALAWAFPAQRPGSPARAVVLVVLCLLVLGLHSFNAWRFGTQTKAIDAAMRGLAPGERGLSLAFDPGSDAARHRRVNVHYPAWYQAEMNGLVDFNFAWFPPQIVRFRPERLPRVAPGFEWSPSDFDWDRHEGWRYRYFFTYGTVPGHVFKGAPCAPARIFSEGRFAIYENRPCR
jgi:hypothetical protein